MSGPGTFFGLEIGRRGLQASRKALDVTGHNLANASTTGYTRQDAVHVASDPHSLPVLNDKLVPGQLGSGVMVESVRRIRDEYLDAQARDVYGASGFWDAKTDVTKKVEAVLSEPSDNGIQTLIGNFFNAWQDLNNTPQDMGLRSAVREVGQELATTFRQTYAQVTEVRQQTEKQISDKVDRINEVTKEITDLSSAIVKVKSLGEQPNDLLDKRDLLLDELGSVGKLTTTESADGNISVSLYGQELVSTDNVQTAVTTADATAWATTSTETGGMVGYVNSLSNIDDYLNKLDQLALGLTGTVNALHADAASGYPNFFTATGASDFDVSAEVQAGVDKINGSQCLNIATQRTKLTMSSTGYSAYNDPNNTVTFESYFQGLVAQIGADAKGAGSRSVAQKAVKDQVDALRNSVAGVSIDEELTKMMQYQYAYQAAARTITVMDQLLDTLINRTAV